MSARITALMGAREAARLMTDRCRIYRVGEPVFNPATGRSEYPETDLYTGKCRVRPNNEAVDIEGGVRQLVAIPFLVSVPLSVVSVEGEDMLEILTAYDSSLAWQILRIKGIVRGTHVTARRLACEEVSP